LKLLNKPGFSGVDIRQACLPGVQDPEKRRRLSAYSQGIETEEQLFHALADAGNAWAMAQRPSEPQMKSDMEWYYSARLMNSAPGRHYVSLLKENAGDQCPFCHIARATTLDHSYPKSQYPLLAMDPLNLVPSCRDCNLGRNAGTGKLTVSPYYDTWIEGGVWLSADISDLSRPENLTFTVIRSETWSEIQWKNVVDFCQDTRLLERYATQAVDEFIALVFGLRLFANSPALEVVRGELATRHEGARQGMGPNRWQTAAYAAWRANADDINWDVAGTAIWS
jgi:hypothetical protein